VHATPFDSRPPPSASSRGAWWGRPLGVPGTRPPTTEDIQAFVERLGFAACRLVGCQLGDTFGGLKYQYYQSEHWLLARDRHGAVPDGTMG